MASPPDCALLSSWSPSPSLSLRIDRPLKRSVDSCAHGPKPLPAPPPHHRPVLPRSQGKGETSRREMTEAGLPTTATAKGSGENPRTVSDAAGGGWNELWKRV